MTSEYRKNQNIPRMLVRLLYNLFVIHFIYYLVSSSVCILVTQESVRVCSHMLY